MSRKLRMACPLCAVLLFVLTFCALSMNTKAVSGSQDVENENAVTFAADPWTNSGVAAAATAQEASAETRIEPTSALEEVSAKETYTVPSQPHCDSGYKLTEQERIEVECVVMCEAGGEGEKGQMMVAQCILDGLLRYDYTVEEYIRNYKVMSTSYDTVTDEVRNSVSRVFDNGERVIEAQADLWYNPAIVASEWHEEQEYVTTIGSHRFFWMSDDNA